MPFLHISPDELARARQRLTRPEWEAAAAAVREEARAAAGRWGTLPAFDHGWFDANPGRDFGETYDLFAAYAYPAWELLEDALKLALADALWGEERYTAQATQWVLHVVHRFRFHVRHHDDGLNYGHVARLLATLYTHLAPRLAAADCAACHAQLEACGEALRLSTRHWLANLAYMPYNNHYAHHRAGLLAVALVLDRADWREEALTGPRTFGELLAGSTTDDGLCYESSTVYHYMTLLGLLLTAELVRHHPALKRNLYTETFANGRCLKDMFDAPLGLMLPNGELPAVGDCYAYRTPLWQGRAGTYEIGYAMYRDPRHAWIIQQAGPRSSLQALLFGADTIEPGARPTSTTRLWPEHGYALLTAGEDYSTGHAAFLTGDRSGVHHHQDALSLQVALGGRLWLEDVEAEAIAVQRFAAPIQKAFNRTMLPHNLVTVDEQDQADNPAVLPVLEFKNLSTCRTVSMGDPQGAITPGVKRLRAVALTAEYGLDIYQVSSADEHVYDYLIHPRADGAAECFGLEFAPASLPERNPYAVLREVTAAAVGASGARLEWAQGVARCRCDISVRSGQGAARSARPMQLLRASWPTRSDHTGPWREMFFVRLRASAAIFLALYQPAPAGEPWRMEGCEYVFNGESTELRVTVAGGGARRQHIIQHAGG